METMKIVCGACGSDGPFATQDVFSGQIFCLECGTVRVFPQRMKFALESLKRDQAEDDKEAG